jgi:stage IV sporulation protein FA
MKHDSIKRRREERLRELREQMNNKTWHESFSQVEEEERIESQESRYFSSYLPSGTEREWEWDAPDEGDTSTSIRSIGTGSKFLIKTTLALFILSGVFLIKQSSLPYTEPVKDFINQAMTREYNFTGTMAAIEQYVGKTPEILPTLSVQKPAQPALNQNVGHSALEKPVNGTVVSPFVMDGKSIQIEAKPGSNVQSIDQGWVIFIGQKEGLGQTVVIQHGNHMQSWYANVDHIKVGEQDWVQPGQLIGQVKQGKPLYFSMLKDDHYIDPTSVISFD